MPGEMRLVSPVAEIERVDLIEGIAGLALALKHDPLAVGRPVAFARALAFDRQPADARQEVALLVRGRLLSRQGDGEETENQGGAHRMHMDG